MLMPPTRTARRLTQEQRIRLYERRVKLGVEIFGGRLLTRSEQDEEHSRKAHDFHKTHP